MRIIKWTDGELASVVIANAIADSIRQKPDAVLGLATGSSPVGVYDELIRLHRDQGLSFRHVTTFNLDEYWPMEPNHRNSYHRFMRKHLFDHIDIERSNVHIPDGTVGGSDLKRYCAAYEQAIEDAGGIDVQLLGVGRNGHIAFNEPNSQLDSRTRLVTLSPETRNDNVRFFDASENVPLCAITMGLGTIMDAGCIYALAFGLAKAQAVCAAVTGPVSPACPASVLQKHGNVTWAVDTAALKLVDLQKRD